MVLSGELLMQVSTVLHKEDVEFSYFASIKTNYHKFIKNSTPEDVFNKDGIFAKSFQLLNLILQL